MKTVYFTTRFPSSSNPVYVEIHNDIGHIIYSDSFCSVDEMKNRMEALFPNEVIHYDNLF